MVEVDEIIRAKRKTLCVQVTMTGKVVVRAPKRVSNRAIERFVAEKEYWIVSKKEEAAKKRKAIEPIKYADGEMIPYLGGYHRLNIVKNLKSPLVFDEGFFLDSNYSNLARILFISWYRKKARGLIAELVEKRAKLEGLQYNRIRITSAKRTLGSCSGVGNLNFSWRLLFAPHSVVEYVVAHELTHLIHHNHSKAFWAKVEEMFPNYKEQEKWIRNNGHLMVIEL